MLAISSATPAANRLELRASLHFLFINAISAPPRPSALFLNRCSALSIRNAKLYTLIFYVASPCSSPPISQLSPVSPTTSAATRYCAAFQNCPQHPDPGFPMIGDAALYLG
ncbi:hypothetical protein BDW69DRAFT_163264 [Aspergillus filifer]